MIAATVLLVFEEHEDFAAYASALCALGYRILVRSSADEAIQDLENEDLSAVIVSQGTHAFEGRRVLERSLQLHPHVPVLVIARVLDVQCYLEAMDLGASDYLERPDPHDMLWVLDTEMRRTAAN